MIERNAFADEAPFGEAIFSRCRAAQAELVAMGGFLQHVPIPADFENRVVNIHPALIPAFCGRGMYGHRVHEAVLDYGAKLSGCTVHFVDNEYDHGPIILQRAVPVCDDDTPERLAARVFAAEREAYPEASGVNRRRAQCASRGAACGSPGRSGLLKKRTGSEPRSVFLENHGCREVLVPLFQRAGGGSAYPSWR